MAAKRQFRWRWGLAAILAVGLAAWLVFALKPRPKPARPPAIPVYAARVSVQDVPLTISALGSALPWQGVTVRTQVNGLLKRVNFTEGTDVTAGQLLAEIDSAPYRAVLIQAQGALMRDRASLAEARIDLKRYQTLAAQDSIARQQVDIQAALVKQDEGTVRLDEGTVAAAQVNVNYCRIVSPVTGRIGVRLVDPGNVVSTTDTTGLFIVNQLVPIAVIFTVPQGDFQRLSQLSAAFSRPLSVQALSQETGAVLGVGELSIADNHIDQATGTVELKARFPNTTQQLWPGQFINVELTLQTLTQATTVPAAAVNQGPNGPFAYVVGVGQRVSMRPLTIQATEGAIAVVKAGLKPGEVVVTDGQLILKPGAAVSIRPSASAQKPAA